MKLIIHYLYVANCPDCKRMLYNLDAAIAIVKADADIYRYCCDDDENGKTKDPKGLDLAINHGIEDLPACIIGEYVFYGKKNHYDEILEAVRTLWTNLKMGSQL